jgi:sulfhydrogenase subunit delta
MPKPKIGIFGLTGCAGDQLVILNCEDQLLDVVNAVDIRDFLTASSAHDDSHLDVAFVEGAVLSRRDEETLKQIRERSTFLVALGTCAVWGGIPALDRDRNRDEMFKTVYGDQGRHFDTLPTKALHEVVKVDLNITGCPIEKDEFLAAVSNLLNGNPPLPPDYAVCAECKWKENNCLLIEKGELCLGAMTVAGCKARCPELNIACVGCRGPSNDANLKSALAMFKEKGFALQDVANKFRTFAPVQLPEMETR